MPNFNNAKKEKKVLMVKIGVWQN